MIRRNQRIDIDYDWLFPCVFSPLIHENTPLSFIIQETGVFWKFFDSLKCASENSEAHLLVFVIEYFLCDIDGPILGLLEGSAHVFADDADAEQLAGAQQQDQYDDGGVAGDGDAPDQLLDDGPQQVKYRCHGGNAA